MGQGENAALAAPEAGDMRMRPSFLEPFVNQLEGK